MPSFFQKNKRMILAVILIGLIASPLALVPINKVEAQGAENPVEGGWLGLVINFFGDWFAWIMNNLLIPTAAWILGLAGNLMDMAIKFSLDTKYFKIDAIDSGWKLIRDLVNMGFIFILLYIAISTILQLSSYNIRSMLAKLIIAAVLINFSLFFTRVAIDASNIVAQNFYNAFTVSADGNPNISATFKNYLRISEKFEKNSGKPLNIVGIDSYRDAVLRFVVIVVALYVFLSVALLFVARTVAFIFLMMTAPIGFIGAIFPGASGAAAQWRKTLIDQMLVAPVFLILIYLVAQIMKASMFNLDLIGETEKALDVNFYFNYVIIIALLLFTKNITKKISGKAGAMINDFGKKALAVAAGATLALATGGAAAIGRGTIGAFAKGAATGTGFKGRITAGFKNVVSPVVEPAKKFLQAGKTQGFGKATLGVAALGATKAVEATRKAAAEGSYDVRRAKLQFTGTIGDASKKYLGVDMGKALSPAERERQRRTEEEQRKKDVAESKYEKDSADLLRQIAEAERAQAAGNPAAVTAAEQTITRILNQMSSKDITRLDSKSTLSKQSVVKSLKGDDIKALEDSKDLTAEEKNSILDSRIETVASASGLTTMRDPSGKLVVNPAVAARAVTPAMQAEIDKIVGRMSETEVSRLDPTIALHNPVMQSYNAKQVKAIRDKGHLNAAQQTTLTSAIGPTHKAFNAEEEKSQATLRSSQNARALRSATAGGAVANITRALNSMRGPDDWKSLDGSIISQPAVINNLTPAHLDAIQQAGTLTQPEKAHIASRIIGGRPPTDPAVKYLQGPAGLLWT